MRAPAILPRFSIAREATLRWQANWIWAEDSNPEGYNQAAWATRAFTLKKPGAATLAITADSWYRVWVNGAWIADGPCRSWPWRTQFDVLDVAPHLRAGENGILVLARHWGCGNFHQRPQKAGILAQLEVKDGARKVVLGTDASWTAAACKALRPNVPKVSIQMEPQEMWDARLLGKESWAPAAVIAEATKGPWKNLTARDVKLLTRKPMQAVATGPARLVDNRLVSFAFDTSRALHPGLIEANASVSSSSAIATKLVTRKATTLRVGSGESIVCVDGKRVGNKPVRLRAGQHLLVVLSPDPFMHHGKHKSAYFPEGLGGVQLAHPWDKRAKTPWAFIAYPEAAFAADDMLFISLPHPEREALRKATRERGEALGKASRDIAKFTALAKPMEKAFDPADFLLEDPHQGFAQRRIVKGDARVDALDALLSDDARGAVVHPSPKGDTEIHLDLGVQSVGYHDFEVIAPAGTIIDIAQVEAAGDDGSVHRTSGNANSARYICAEGVNRFLSTTRRSGRHVFITVRDAAKPVELRRFCLVESTYPVERKAAFKCSDPLLEQTWEIAERTLKLCMEDTFTDCPLYEQTLWVGDARNESLYAYRAFDAVDIGRRCIRLAAESMEILPFVGCQVPSAWDCVLPAWSFLWGISVWDHYEYTGDKAILADHWPAVMQNIDGAASFVDERGLFSGPFWNLMDWAGIDQNQHTVLHNTMLLVGAIDAAIKAAKVLGKAKDAARLRAMRRRFVAATLATMDQKTGYFPDSFHDDGKPSKGRSIHTVFLSYLYDMLPAKDAKRAAAIMAKPPKRLTPVGTPFAIQYLFEAMEKVGLGPQVVDRIREEYGVMLRRGATTVWETFATSGFNCDGYPTRSPCHAWSSAPMHFLPRIVLGIQQTKPGGAAFDISPTPCGLSWAEGQVATPRGPVKVSWEIKGKELVVKASAPKGVRLQLRANPSHKGLRTRLERA